MEKSSDERVISQGFNANDVIICEGTDGQRWSTDWVVYYGTKVKFGAGYKTSTTHCSVSITVNGSMLSDCYMQVGKDGYCVFPGGHKSPPRIVLHTLDLIPGLNVICYELKGRLKDMVRILVAKCHIFKVVIGQRLVVCDIDGTVTARNLTGLVLTLSPGLLDDALHSQPGICKLLNLISNEGATIIYLTARPIALAAKTRAFLMGLKQSGYLLPVGPLFTCESKTSSVVYRELISKDIYEYKARALQHIAETFHRAGHDIQLSVFSAGIGNAHTDGVAYSAAGIPLDSIFIINPAYEIQHWSPEPSKKGRKRLSRKGSPKLKDRNESADSALSESDDGYHYLSYEDPMFTSRIKDLLASNHLTNQNSADSSVVGHEGNFDLIGLDSS